MDSKSSLPRAAGEAAQVIPLPLSLKAAGRFAHVIDGDGRARFTLPPQSAAFIVRACNNHKGLVALVESALKWGASPGWQRIAGEFLKRIEEEGKS